MPDIPTVPDPLGQGREAPADGGDNGFDYRRAYEEELRPAYTRATQELAQYREQVGDYEGLFAALHSTDEEERQAAFDALGLDYVPETPAPQNGDEEQWTDPLEEEVRGLRSQLEVLRDAHEATLAAEEDAEVQALRDDYIGEAISYIEEALSTPDQPFEFTPREEEALGNLAIAMTDDDGIPDVQGAYAMQYGGPDSVIEINRARWIDSKTRHAQAPSGRSIPGQPDFRRSAESRVAYIDERLRADNQVY